MINKPTTLLNELDLLYVESDPKHLKAMRELLTPHFKTIRVAQNGQEGIDSFIEQPASIVITEIDLPQMNGADMARYIKEYDSSVPILFTADHHTTPLLADAIDVGVDAFLSKPLESSKLFERLNRVAKSLMESQQQQKLSQQMQMLLDHQQQPTMLATKGKINGANQEMMRILGVLSIEDINSMLTMHQNFTQDSQIKILDAMELGSENWVEGLIALSDQGVPIQILANEKRFDIKLINSDDAQHQIITLHEPKGA